MRRFCAGLPEFMRNPWLSVLLSDYEGHMSSPQVQQLGVLADLFAEALAHRSPVSVAILGIAGGNGLDRIDNTITKRIVGLDVNPFYLEAVHERYPDLAGLELHCINLAESLAELEPVELVHAALVFEHAGTGRCLDNALGLVGSKGTLSVVLQLPSLVAENVAPSAFSSMQNLKSDFSLVHPNRTPPDSGTSRISADFRETVLPACGQEFLDGPFWPPMMRCKWNRSLACLLRSGNNPLLNK